MNRFPDFAVACGEEGSDPTVLHDGEPVRVDEFAASGHLRRQDGDLAAVRELGVEIWRYGMPWRLTEPEPGRYDWNLWDRALDSCARHGLVPVIDLCHFGLPDHYGGFCDGTWSVLVHMFPDADVPVVQLSINALQPLDYHLDIGRRLAPLRDEGVLVVASGNVVHNLRRIAWGDPTGGFDWAQRFGGAVREMLSSTPGDLLRLVDHQDFELAVPTPDHFIPLLYVAGLAEASDATTDVLIDGYAYGSLSMACYTVGARCSEMNSEIPAATIPPPADLPIDQSNL